MIEDDGGPPRMDDHGLSLLYDWFKHLTSLSLLTIGGVLSLTQGAEGAGIKKALLVIVLVFVGICGLLSFSCAGEVVRARADGTVLPRYVQHLRAVASMSLAIGVGAFTYIFLGTL
jgi:hypothetical protein